MTTKQLVEKLEALGLKLPVFGSGRNGKILNDDLEDVIAKHFAKDLKKWGQKARLELGHVMLAARYDDCNEHQQDTMFRDNSGWVLEEKYDGVRITVFGHPTEGYSAFSRGRSKATCLPIEYTQNILVQHGRGTCALGDTAPRHSRFMLDCELVTAGCVELPDGSYATGLNAVVAVLSQSDPAAAHRLQRTTCPLEFKAFDYLPANSKGALLLDEKYEDRCEELQGLCKEHPFMNAGRLHSRDKAQIYDQYLASGKEGVVFKHANGVYVPARHNKRDRDTCVKCKRTMRNSKTSDIDVWIAEGYSTPEWSKLNLVGGLHLHVTLLDEDGECKEHHIASVTSMPDEIRTALSLKDGTLNPECVGRVVTIDGQDVSARNRRITHARVDWKRGFRTDKNIADCTLDESFLDSQIF